MSLNCLHNAPSKISALLMVMHTNGNLTFWVSQTTFHLRTSSKFKTIPLKYLTTDRLWKFTGRDDASSVKRLSPLKFYYSFWRIPCLIQFSVKTIRHLSRKFSRGLEKLIWTKTNWIMLCESVVIFVVGFCRPLFISRTSRPTGIDNWE